MGPIDHLSLVSTATKSGASEKMLSESSRNHSVALMSFAYLTEKIRAADFLADPFLHLQINDFFSEEHFARITQAPEIAISGLRSDEHLFQKLFESGYKIINFPGCITDKDKYLSWHKQKSAQRHLNNSACEGFGITLRLTSAVSPVIAELMDFLGSHEFQSVLAQKFSVRLDDVFYDAGIQKYLDGYEISPHPDIRKKALTYMVNINPYAGSSDQDHHTHYLKFRDAYQYVRAYWEGNPKFDRCWVPWDWCEIRKTQRQNNSIVIFSPNNETMHGVKARYDHLAGQRTQLYGNLWYHKSDTVGAPEWEDFCLSTERAKSLKTMVKAAIPESAKQYLRNMGAKKTNVIADRLSKD